MTEQNPPSAVATTGPGAAEPQLTPYEVMERVIADGDLGKMSAQDRIAFYWRVCESVGLNPLTQPFGFIRQQDGKIGLYAKKDATDQIRASRGISVAKLERERTDDLMTVVAYGRDKGGREDSSTGVVSIQGLRGEALANAIMKAETKAKRRMTLSLAGLGFLDESEAPSGAIVDVDPATGALAAGATTAPAGLLEQVQAQAAALAGEQPAAAATPSAPEAPASTEKAPAAETPPAAPAAPAESAPTPPAPTAPAPEQAAEAPVATTAPAAAPGPSDAAGADPEPQDGDFRPDPADLEPTGDQPMVGGGLTVDDFKAKAVAAGITKGKVRKAAMELFPGNDQIALVVDPATWGLTPAEWQQLATTLELA